MNNFMVYSLFMLMLSICLVMMSLNLYFMEYGFLYEWLIYSMNSINVEMILLVDWVSILFIGVVMLISSMVLLFCCSYMDGEKFIDRFMILVILFILSMILMIISPNVISILFGWDGLGLVSYCLVIYYQNMISYNSGMLTVLSNRIGDIGLLMAISMIMIKGSWNNFYLSNLNFVVLMMLLAAITKSAQIPFSSWLPMAMAAPTPVSALVHSSTLVTAGVYLMIRFNKFLMSSYWSILLLYLSVITMFMAGLMANMENDFKKIIALSTLSQLGLMMMILSIGLNMLALFHLLTHAIFKSLLFLCAGAIIHSMNNNQDIRFYGNLNEFLPYVMNGFYISSISLCGFPFLSGFYSKDLIMELMYFSKVNLMIYILIMISLVLTVSYSFRMIYYIYFGEINSVSSVNSIKENFIVNFSMFILILMSIVAGSLMMWLFFMDLKFIYLEISVKLCTLMMCTLGVFLSVVIYITDMMKLYFSVFFISSMWYLNYMFSYIYKPFMIIGVNLYVNDKVWFEFFKKKIFTFLMKDFLKISLGKSKIYMYVYMLILIIVYSNL